MLNTQLVSVVIGIGVLVLSTSALSQQANSSSLTMRFAHYDRDFSNDENDRVQTGLGFQLAHKRSFFNDKVELGVTLFRAQKLASSGREVEDLLGSQDRQTNSFSQIGETHVLFRPLNTVELTLGRFQHESLLLKSKTRLLPSTFQGGSMAWAISDSIKLKAVHLTKWSRRADNEFNGFNTELNSPGGLKNIRIISLSHSNNISNTRLEVLLAKNYLTKLGLESELTFSVKDHLDLTVKGGAFSSHDAGGLFVAGADSTLDSPSDVNDKQRLKHNGVGGYLQLGLTKQSAGLEQSIQLTHSRFGDAWLEDNFAGDHGTSPFPSSTIGPELTNHHERLWLASYQANIKSGVLEGLSSKLSFTNGYGAFNSLDSEFGNANESWSEIDLKYKSKALTGFSVRARYRDYKATETGRIAGVKDNRDELRITADYEIKF